MEKRLVLFCFYDPMGIADRNTRYLVRELQKVADKLIVIVNGTLNEAGRTVFRELGDVLIERENEGFDAGAYADVLLNHLTEDELDEYDALVLCNDTFFGPFIGFEDILGRINPDVDMAGLTVARNGLTEHLQSYFLYYRRAVFTSLQHYFKSMINGRINSFAEAHSIFETGLFCYLTKKGFKYQILFDTKDKFIYDWPDVCIEEFGLPILKKKTFAPLYYYRERQINVLCYLKERNLYNICDILEYAKRTYDIKYSESEVLRADCLDDGRRRKMSKAVVSKRELRKFLRKNENIYIYGAGLLGGEIYESYSSQIKNFKGFLVSELSENMGISFCGHPIFRFSDMIFGSNDAVIVAMMPGYTGEVAEMLKGTIKSEKRIICLYA